MAVRQRSRGRTVVVGAVYRPPASSIPGALELIDQQFRDAVSTGKPVIIMRDLNTNLLRQTSPAARSLQRILSDLGLTQLVREPTHLHQTPTMLDLVMTNLTDSPRSRRGPPGAGGRPPAGSSQSQGAQTAPPAAGAGHQAALGACRLECRVPQLPDRRLGTALQRADGRREGGRLHGGLGLGSRRALSAGDGETAPAGVSMAVRQPRADVVNGGRVHGCATTPS